MAVFSSTSFHKNPLIHETLPWMCEQQNTWLRSRVSDILENCFHLVSELHSKMWLSGFLVSFFFFFFVEQSIFNFQQMSTYNNTLIIPTASPKTVINLEPITSEPITSENGYLLDSRMCEAKNSLWVEWMLGNGSTGRFHGPGPGMQPAVASLQETGPLTSLPVLLFTATG